MTRVIVADYIPINCSLKTNKEYNEEIYQDFIKERKEAQRKNISPFPLYLFSKRVYKAYRNAWRLIDRSLLTIEEINIMLKLGIYKPSQKDISIQNLDKDLRREMSKIRIGV